MCRSIHQSHEKYISVRSHSRISINDSFIPLDQRGFSWRKKASRAEERANPRAEGASLGRKSEQRYIHQRYRKSRAETTPRAEDYLVQREKASRPHIDSNLINLVNNPSRHEHTAVYLSINHSSISAREESSGRGE